jgi:predicted DCC family thiol-disulfide oxidoreductase YuxK
VLEAGRERSSDAGSANGYVLLYDGECEICRRSVAWLEGRDRKGVIRTIPYQDPSVGARFPEIPRGQLENAMHLISSDGSRWAGARAAEEIFRLLPGLWWTRWAFRAPGVRSVAAMSYRWFARNRRRFGCGAHCGIPRST